MTARSRRRCRDQPRISQGQMPEGLRCALRTIQFKFVLLIKVKSIIWHLAPGIWQGRKKVLLDWFLYKIVSEKYGARVWPSFAKVEGSGTWRHFRHHRYYRQRRGRWKLKTKKETTLSDRNNELLATETTLYNQSSRLGNKHANSGLALIRSYL